jgi:ATP-dependent protease ClpP protease subunit
MEYVELDLDEMLWAKAEWTLFDKEVPILRDGNTLHCYLADDIGEPKKYNELCFVLDTIEDDMDVKLHISTMGGHLDSAFKLLASLKKTKAPTTAVLTGTVASAGTIITLGCDNLECEDYTSFMIHNYSSGVSGKGNEMVDYLNFTDKTLRRTFKEIYGGFLTDREITSVIKGKDMWLDKADVDKRWARMKGE